MSSEINRSSSWKFLASSSTSLSLSLMTEFKPVNCKYACLRKSMKPLDHSLRVSEHCEYHKWNENILSSFSGTISLAELVYKTPASRH